ncbi:polysaccharide deacetylase family protein [Microtetraspora glauca]|uniref:Polysaccharide deacetylase family protein n=1 Tax=Microtetraspora glauca TaxID=1996 RepID=A0ABV3G8U5_MICGL
MKGNRRLTGVIIGLTLAAGCAEGGTTQAESTAPAKARSPLTATSPSASPTPRAALPRPGEVARIPRPAEGIPVVSSIPTKRKVVFLTIDDGWEQDPGFLKQVRDQRIPITVFAMRDAVEATGSPDAASGGGRYVGAGKWDYFRDLRDAGAPIENHTFSHPNLWTLGYERQKAEICGMSTLIRKEIGRRPTLFRPPFGNHNAATARAAGECGIKAIMMWTATVQPGGKIAYQVPDKKLRPGDILLLHFRPNMARDFRVLVNKIRRRGFEIGDLRAYMRAGGVPVS